MKNNIRLRLRVPITAVRLLFNWKLGYLLLWWMRMAREGKVQKEEKSMKNSMATFLQNKINKNVNLDITKNFPDDKRTPPVEKCDNDDVIKGCYDRVPSDRVPRRPSAKETECLATQSLGPRVPSGHLVSTDPIFIFCCCFF